MGYYITAELEVKNISEQEKEEIQQYIEENEDVNDKIDWLLSTFADGTIMGMIFAEDESEVVS